MGFRHLKNKRTNRRSRFHNADNNVDIFIERLKKIRALNGDPALFGIDNYVFRRICFNRFNIMPKR